MELWSGGGCERRCDGVRNVITDSPCECDPDPERRLCKPTTRLSVVLREVRGAIGLWRLESHGYYAAVELPPLAALLSSGRGEGGYLRADLVLVERVVKRPGQGTRRFLVPGLEVEDLSPDELMSGSAPERPAIEAGTDSRPALPPAATAPQGAGAGPSAPEPVPDRQLYIDSAAATGDLDQLSGLLKAAQDDGLALDMTLTADPVVRAFLAARARLAVSEPPAGGAGGSDEPSPNLDELWAQILRAAPEDWTTTQVSADFKKVTGVLPAAATALHMARYLSRAATPTGRG
jgi:hypothetical protein